jgi:hypothetical protein
VMGYSDSWVCLNMLLLAITAQISQVFSVVYTFLDFLQKV